MGKLKRYPNPAKAGAFLLLDDAEAKRLGLTQFGEERVAPPAPPDEVHEGPVPIVVEHGQEPATPKGALAPAGPTRRARERAAADAALAGLLEVEPERVAALNSADPVMTYLEICRHREISLEDFAELGELDRHRAALEAFEDRATLTEEALAERLAPELEEEPVNPETDPATPAPDAPAGADEAKDKARPAPRGGRRRRPAGEAPAE